MSEKLIRERISLRTAGLLTVTPALKMVFRRVSSF